MVPMFLLWFAVLLYVLMNDVLICYYNFIAIFILENSFETLVIKSISRIKINK